MWGDKDIILEPKFARQFKADLSNSKLIMYPGVGHIPMEELPKKTADDAKLFLLGNGNDIE
jgi:pimeloyl-ACP methyl ester carboxylesterase